MDRFHTLGWTYRKNILNHHQLEQKQGLGKGNSFNVWTCLGHPVVQFHPISLVHIGKKKGCSILFQILLLAMSCLYEKIPFIVCWWPGCVFQMCELKQRETMFVSGRCNFSKPNSVKPNLAEDLGFSHLPVGTCSATYWSLWSMNSRKFKFYFSHIILNMYILLSPTVFFLATRLSQHILFFRNPARKPPGMYQTLSTMGYLPSQLSTGFLPSTIGMWAWNLPLVITPFVSMEFPGSLHRW